MKRKLTPRTLGAIVGAAILVFAAAGYFMVVSPKKAESARLDEEIATASLELRDALAATAAQDDTQPIAVADIFRLSVAMPSTPDMPGILLELSRIADETGIRFKSITPQPALPIAAYQVVPIDVAFDGSFYALSDFLFRLRTLVTVRRGELHAAGRLFSVASVDFSESDRGFPLLAATLKLNAYVYGLDARRRRGPAAGCDAARDDDGGPAGRHRGNRKRGDRVMAKRVDPLKAKEAKQKKIAIGGAILLLALLGVQGPKTLKMLQGPKPAAAPASTAPATTTPGAAPAPGATTTGGEAAPAAAPSELSAVADSDLAPEAEQGQLATFERFSSKDPFAQQAGPVASDSAPVAAPNDGTEKEPVDTKNDAQPAESAADGEDAADGGFSTGGSTPEAPELAAATSISVNGVAEDVAVEDSFPKDEPTFVLVEDRHERQVRRDRDRGRRVRRRRRDDHARAGQEADAPEHRRRQPLRARAASRQGLPAAEEDVGRSRER